MIRACPFGEVGVSADVAWAYVTERARVCCVRSIRPRQPPPGEKVDHHECAYGSFVKCPLPRRLNGPPSTENSSVTSNAVGDLTESSRRSW